MRDFQFKDFFHTSSAFLLHRDERKHFLGGDIYANMKRKGEKYLHSDWDDADNNQKWFYDRIYDFTLPDIGSFSGLVPCAPSRRRNSNMKFNIQTMSLVRAGSLSFKSWRKRIMFFPYASTTHSINFERCRVVCLNDDNPQSCRMLFTI